MPILTWSEEALPCYGYYPSQFVKENSAVDLSRYFSETRVIDVKDIDGATA